MKNLKQIILASKSPRRKMLLENLGVSFDVVESNIDEKLNCVGSADKIAKELALRKAKKVAELHKSAIVIGADTVVVSDEILGKPECKDDARKILRSLSGKSHEVITGLALINKDNNKTVIAAAKTRVYFKYLTNEEIEKYLSHDEYKDKAGSYAIQGKASLFIEKIEGDYNNVVGLPLFKLEQLLRENFNITLI
ncbi:Maf family protein [Serpentinicella sp. ANB-PHB4]|uniref:Maf family protein n=1 Tax=Serpentinicella sp. ANB-PHB4 TaxID=3074076 RepID=UPI002856AF49|nr:Maf family protein [Serpentinicella sp. ANB-PHB4]MDR5657885.1 Maf family protein [Serpentinicella sp. ANB-PHB4]